jgi:S1-C subfamily serine protease
VNGLDLILVALAIAAAVGGWRLGFLRRSAGWLGAAAGTAAAIVLAPALIRRLGLDSDLAVVLVVTALLVLLASIGQGIGATIGARLRQEVESPAARHMDAVGGTLLGVVAVAVLAWLVLPVMADAEGWPSASTRGSLLARLVTTYLPAPPPQIQELERQLVGGDYPQLFADLQEAPEIPPAPEGSPVSQELLDSVAPSAVRLQSEACRQVQSGSGFFVDDGLIATNAHVVAGASEVSLTTADGAEGSGRVVAFDPSVDLALVSTELDRPGLSLAPPAEGDRGLVLGFPGGGPFAPSPFEIGQLLDARGFDIYDDATVDREILALASALEPGDSGSAVLRADGEVVGIAVAVAPDRAEVAYALNSSELRSLLAAPVTDVVSTGPCTS